LIGKTIAHLNDDQSSDSEIQQHDEIVPKKMSFTVKVQTVA